ncbi:MAG: RsiW-degrading membrane proteinase PrsW (M82 family) [Cognaticolwellia sp.]|jgi:RsiW-degrading membrane proteinase PrsW (M82 family)
MQLVLLVLSLVFAVVPLVVFLGIVWWLDRYDREPLWMVGLTFGWGATGAIVGALIFSSIFMLPFELLVSPEAADGIGATFIAPLVEEPSKAIFLLAIYFSRHFDNTTDGFVYGAAVGLGFGMTENFLYFTSVAQTGDLLAWGGTVVIRTLYSAMMHACASSVVGAALGFVKFRSIGYKLLIPPIGLAVAMAIHALWNGLLTLDGVLAAEGAFAVLNFLLFPLEFAALFITLQVCLQVEKRMIRRELASEAILGWLPQEHVQILSSTLARNRKTWLPKGVDQDQYVVAATTLAFRKHQAHGNSNPTYASEVTRLRGELQGMLQGAST